MWKQNDDHIIIYVVIIRLEATRNNALQIRKDQVNSVRNGPLEASFMTLIYYYSYTRHHSSLHNLRSDKRPNDDVGSITPPLGTAILRKNNFESKFELWPSTYTFIICTCAIYTYVRYGMTFDI